MEVIAEETGFACCKTMERTVADYFSSLCLHVSSFGYCSTLLLDSAHDSSQSVHLLYLYLYSAALGR